MARSPFIVRGQFTNRRYAVCRRRGVRLGVRGPGASPGMRCAAASVSPIARPSAPAIPRPYAPSSRCARSGRHRFAQMRHWVSRYSRLIGHSDCLVFWDWEPYVLALVANSPML